MNEAGYKKSRIQWMGRLMSTILSNLSAIIAILVITIPAVGWSFSDTARNFIEGNSYRIESIDRYAIPLNAYTRLKGSNALTRIAVVMSGSSPCSQQSPQTNANLTADAPGVLAAIRYTRRSGTNSIYFEITSGHILFIGMQGDDLPGRICFNERRDQFLIEYTAGDVADISPQERVLFIQTDEPASDIRSIILRERSSAYFAVASMACICMFVFFVGLLVLIIRNSRHDRSFEKTANVKLDKLDIDVAEVREKQKMLESVMRDSSWIKELLQRSSIARMPDDLHEQKVSLQELERQGTADGERRFSAGAADIRQRVARSSELGSKCKPQRNADPRMEIREMKSDLGKEKQFGRRDVG